MAEEADFPAEVPVTAGKSERPLWTRKYLREGDIEKIEAAIADIEKVTDGEVIPMVVRESIRPSAPTKAMFSWYLFCIFALVALILPHLNVYIFHDYEWVELAVAAAILGVILDHIPGAKRIIMRKPELHQAVQLRAEHLFYRAGLHRTKNHVGILIFLSLAERVAVVLADEGIASKLEKDVWNKVVKSLTGAAQRGELAEGLRTAIHMCGKILAQYCPRQMKTENEIPNRLIILE